jgi:hypothetical protein
MTQHIDVIKNDPLAGVQRRIATITADGDELTIEPEAWRERIEQLAGSVDGHRPDEYLALVIDRLADATYVSASEAHTAEDCPFADADEITVVAEGEPHLAGAQR